MREIAGRQTLDTLEELLTPDRCALVVIDMQRGAVESGGAMGRDGQAVSRVAAIAPRCGAAIATARAAGVLIAHVRVANLPGAASSSPAWLRSLARVSRVDPSTLSVEGTWETEFCDDCRPEPGELVVTKRRPSAFHGTDLELTLRAAGVETVVVVGTATPGCVSMTIRDAAQRDFYNVLVEDCVDSNDEQLHEAELRVLRARHDHCTLQTLSEIWGRG
ncbi:cysteine hydrolase family protein [Patulibacter defluvii]|uniref:cysteine hydrolase family protein n=1 Tax=Patulibacter defluvii TaxID=3095358 RepID=UPI002A75B39B|nr:isochorismatase family cysteine hydrolase [Patulibacter sp. DM4]